VLADSDTFGAAPQLISDAEAVQACGGTAEGACCGSTAERDATASGATCCN
jgi:hypothetical protein